MSKGVLKLCSYLPLKQLPYINEVYEQNIWDVTFLNINKGLSILLTYHVLQYSWTSRHIYWTLAELTIFNTFGSLLIYILFYDIIYASFHRLLHSSLLYNQFHKHHHLIRFPSQGFNDAANTHPVEYGVGIYTHLLAINLFPAHIITVFIFIGLGALMSIMNHTRYEFSIPLLYNNKAHDLHHRNPTVNFGQYSQVWDRLLGTYAEWEPPVLGMKRSSHKNRIGISTSKS